MCALAELYAESTAGSSAHAERDFLVDLKTLLKAANCDDGDERAEALNQLHALNGNIVRLEGPRRDPEIIHQVRVPLANEAALFVWLKEPSPTELRQALANQFIEAARNAVPERWSEAWKGWCGRMNMNARAGESVAPFDRQPSAENAELLVLLPKLLAWEGESLVRFASCVLCGANASKKLETWAAMEREGEFTDQLRGKLGGILEDITSGKIRSLDDLGIVANPRSALIHGPLRLKLDGEWLDLGRLQGSFRLAQSDIERAEEITTTARRCLTVENETSFHELAKLQSGELLIQTTFPGSGTLALLRRLPAALEFWHFGDTDAAGFEILRVLREKSARDFQPLHMEQGRASFEQESLGRPDLKSWPFYGPPISLISAIRKGSLSSSP